MTNTTTVLLVIVIVIGLFLGINYWFSDKPPYQNSNYATSTVAEYRNIEYGFDLKLPDDWRGYTVSIDKWTGDASNDQLGEVAYTTGPVVSIHNPKWTHEAPYQDIPVMVFTLHQWSDLQADKFHIGAAPIGPSKLGENSKYVFAIPARYNYAYPPGWEEADQIIQNKSNWTFFNP